LRVLITGATGYIGGILASRLSEHRGLELLLAVSPGRHEGLLPGVPAIEFDLAGTKRMLDPGKLDAVVHLAAVNELISEKDPQRALDVNVGGTLRLLETVAPRVRHAIYMSTFHVYGANARGRVTEETPIAPVHPYAATHAMAETYFGMYARRLGFAATLLRLSNGYGAPHSPEVNRWTLVVNDLCRQAVEHEKLVLRTHGLQLRDFVHLDDVATAIEILLASNREGVGIYNLGAGQSHAVLDVAKTVRDQYRGLFSSDIEIARPEPPEGYECERLEFAVEALGHLGFTPQKTLAEGVRQTLIFCANHFRGGVDR